MKTFITTAAVWVALTASFAAYAAQPVADVAPKATQTAQAVSRIAGSILDSDQKTVPLPSSFKLPSQGQRCRDRTGHGAGRSGRYPRPVHCQARRGGYLRRLHPIRGQAPGLHFRSAQWPGRELLEARISLCHGATEPKWVHAPHVAFCDVRDAELNACIAKYAQFLVNHPDPARQTFQFKVRASDGTVSTVTVLTTAKQNAGDAERMAVEGTTGATVLARL
jgi:hypothetical protein